jgi:hypothetical protein
MASESIFLDPLTSPLLLFLIQVCCLLANWALPFWNLLCDSIPDDLLVSTLQLALTLFLTRLLGKVFSYLKQPQVVGEIVAGIVLGPSVLGKIPGASGRK